MYQHGTIFILNNRMFIYTHTNSIIKLHYIWFYNVYKLYIFIVKSFIHTKTEVVHHFEKVSLFTGQNSHTRLVLQNTVTR